jgi:hypothetical protein
LFVLLEYTCSWGGEVEILLLAELLMIQISVVQIETLSILTYSPPSNITPKCRVYLLYTGQHYDSIVSSNGSRTESQFPADDSRDCDAIECARTHKQAWEEDLRKRIRKRIKCLGCNTIVTDTAAFQVHCEEIEHDDEFCYECEEIEVEEVVQSPDDD